MTLTTMRVSNPVSAVFGVWSNHVVDGGQFAKTMIPSCELVGGWRLQK